MSTGESLYRAFYEEETFRSSLSCYVERGECGASAGAAHEYLTLVLAVEVDKHVTGHESGFHTACTCELCFLIACEHTLQWSVLYVVAVEYSEFHGAADAVVGTKSSSFCSQPLSIYISLYWVVVKVKIHVNEFVTHHVHVTLQYHCFSVFISRSCRFSDDDVSCFVNLCVKVMAFAPVFQVLDHLFFSL